MRRENGDKARTTDDASKKNILKDCDDNFKRRLLNHHKCS